MSTTRRDHLAGLASLGALAPLSARAQGARPKPLRIGVLTDLSGSYSGTSGPTSVACTRQAIQDFAASKNLEVEVIAGDHQNKADIGAGLARQWYDQGVDMIVDVPNSAVALAVRAIAAERNKAYLNTGAAAITLTGDQCTPTVIHWGYNTTMLASAAGANVASGGKNWFFVVADYSFGRELRDTATAFVQKAGGRVVGSVAYPFPDTTDFASFLLQAQASDADIIAFGNAGADAVNCVKQAHEFGLAGSGKRLAAMLAFIQVIKALGLETAQGLLLTESFYWDMNNRTRAFMGRIAPKLDGNWVSTEQAATYAATLHYLKAADSLPASDRTDGVAVVARMKAMPTDDDCYGSIRIRADGQAMHPAYVFQCKTPAASQGPWDLYDLVSTIGAEEANPPAGTCKLT